MWAASLQFISDSLEKCWALYLELYVATHQGGSYINIRVRFVVKSKIRNFRLLEIPLYKHHTREEILNTLVILLYAILPHWEHTIIGVSTDSAQIISGRIRSIILSIQYACKPGLIRVWCGLHQLDVVM